MRTSGWLTARVNIEMRDASMEDSASIAGLLSEMGYPTSPDAAAARIERFTGDSSSRLLVATLGAGGVVGLVATHIVPRLDDDGLTCRITDIVVSMAHRRTGVGSALMAAAEREARRVGAPRLDLSSGDWRVDAHAFYSRHGFASRARSFTKRLDESP